MPKKKELIPVIYEDEWMFAVNKPPRFVSVPDSTTPMEKSVLGLVRRKAEGQDWVPYLLHRLDAQTSGVLLFGKHEKDRKVLEAITGASTTEKKYLTFLRGVPRGNFIDKFLTARRGGVAVPARTDFRVLATIPVFGIPCALAEAVIRTGRKHQIRQHFASVECPVVMDSDYGDFKFNRKFRLNARLGRQFLHALSVRFEHPFLHKTVIIRSPLAPDLVSVAKKVFGPRAKNLLTSL